MKIFTPSYVIVLMALFWGGSIANAEIDLDTQRKLQTLKHLALSDERMSREQVENSFELKLLRTCSDISGANSKSIHVCSYSQETQDIKPLAFWYFRTLSRTEENEGGSAISFIASLRDICIDKNDISQIMQRAPVLSKDQPYPEAAIPYIPVKRYQFDFPRQSYSDIHIEVHQTGKCADIITLVKNSEY